jgi:WD40 repeat protein
LFRSPDPETDLEVGGEFGDYELLEEIASGGMGVVFKARQKSLNRVVALKTIRPLALRPGDSAAQRFRIEAEAVARLDHPNIVPIFEMGEFAGYPFLSLKLIEGGDLERQIPRFKADPRATAVLMAQVARAVHYAHLRGILHRDLKPSNILVDRRGRPYVTDFGLARCIESDSDLTHTGLILGTPSYMAPEQVSGPRNEVTTAADVYGLGAVLYTMIAGRPPFQADSVYETLQQVREKEPIPPGAGDQTVDRDLEAICLKCLEKDPARRYASSELLAMDLEHWAVGEPIAARPAGPAERAWRWYRRNRLVARLWAGVALLLLAVPIIMVVLFFRQRGLADEANSAAQKERGARMLADARAEDIRWRLVRMNVANGVRLMEQGDTTGALPWFAEALSFDRDDPAAASTHRLRLGILLSQCPDLDGVFAHGRPILWATLAPDGRRLATASSDGSARLWDLESGDPIAELPHDGPVNRVAFRKDGDRLLTASDDGSVRLWDRDGGRSGPTLRLPHGSPVRIAGFLADGRRVVSGGFDGTIRLWNADDGSPMGPAQRLGSSLLDLAVSPEGTRVATGTAAGQARIWRLKGDRLVGAAPLPHAGAVRRVAFSPDGTRIATACHDGTARIWDVTIGDPLTAPLAHSPNRRLASAEFSADGKRLVTASDDGTARIWNARTGTLLGSKDAVMSHSIGIVEASFSPDGARVVTAGSDGTARIWDAATAGPLSPPFYHGGSLTLARFTPEGDQVLTVGTDSTARLWNVTDIGGSAVAVEDAGGIRQAVFDPQGRRFATAGADGTARVWDAKSGEPVTPPLHHRGPVTRVAFGPHGQRLATASEDGTARVWDAANGRPVTYYLPHDGLVRDLRFSPDGSRLATASADGKLRVWDVDTGQTAFPPCDHAPDVLALAFSRDGRWLASAGADGTARVWDAANGQPALPPLELGASVSCVAFRPDGSVLLTACADAGFTELWAQQWDLNSARPIPRPPLRHGDGVLWATYSPDGRRIATASEDRTARVWDAATGEPLTRPLTHEHQVLMADFSPDGRRLATASLDGTARVWDAITGEPLSPPLVHRDRTRVGSVDFQPDGRGLLSAGMDGTARIWSLPRDDRSSDVLVLQAQVLAGRRIDQTGGEVPLETAKLSQAWTRLRSIEGSDQASDARARSRTRSRIAWHRREARRLELDHQPTAAAWHLNRLKSWNPSRRPPLARILRKSAIGCS